MGTQEELRGLLRGQYEKAIEELRKDPLGSHGPELILGLTLCYMAGLLNGAEEANTERERYRGIAKMIADAILAHKVI